MELVKTAFVIYLARLVFIRDLIKMVDKKAVELVFKRIKPLFVEHKGDFQVKEITDDGVVKVKLIGECQLCVYKEKTRRAIEVMLKNEVPDIKKVEIV